jgi:hypothetical protein
MTDPWILYTEEMDQVDGWFFGADVELFSELLACQRAEDIKGDPARPPPSGRPSAMACCSPSRRRI